MDWYRHPLFWIGIVGATATGYVLLRRRRGLADLGAPPPRGGIVLPPGLLSRRLPTSTTAPSEEAEEPPEEFVPEVRDSVPPEEQPPPGWPEEAEPPKPRPTPPPSAPDWEPPEFAPAAPPKAPPECEIVTSTTARLQAKKRKTIIDWNDPDFAVTHLCHAPLRQHYLTVPIAKKEPNRFCRIFCEDVGWKSGACVDSNCVCTGALRGK